VKRGLLFVDARREAGWKTRDFAGDFFSFIRIISSLFLSVFLVTCWSNDDGVIAKTRFTLHPIR